MGQQLRWLVHAEALYTVPRLQSGDTVLLIGTYRNVVSFRSVFDQSHTGDQLDDEHNLGHALNPFCWLALHNDCILRPTRNNN